MPPTEEIEGRQIRLAALATAVAFTLGKHLSAIRVGRPHLASMFHMPGIVVVIILWGYHLLSILILVADFLKAQAGHAGGRHFALRRGPL